MKKFFITASILGLVIGLSTLAYAQQRNASRGQTRSNSTSTQKEDANDLKPSQSENAMSGPSSAPGIPPRPEAPNRPGAPGRPGAPQMGTFALYGLQGQARQKALDGDKVNVKMFLNEFLKVAKDADKDSDGMLSQDELTQLQESMRPQDLNDRARPDGNAPNGGRRRGGAQSAYNNGDDLIVRAQEGRRDARAGSNGLQQGAERNDRRDANMPNPPEPKGFAKAIADSTNEEGSVDIAKLEKALETALKEADADADGFLSNEEWREFTGFGGFGGFGRFGGFGGAGGGPGGAFDPNAMRAMSVSMLLRQVTTEAQTEDGKIDVAKFRAEYVKLLKEFDANKDGVLNEEELQALQTKARESMGMGGPGGAPGFGGSGRGQGGLQRDFLASARTEDGKIDLSKLEDNPMKQGFQEADSNGDGFVDEEEMRSFQDKMRERFQNGGGFGATPGFGGPGFGGPGRGQGDFFAAARTEDGKIDLSKLEDNPMKQGFQEVDSDGDGFIDETELQTFQNKMRERFQNGGVPGARPNGMGAPRDGQGRGNGASGRRNGRDNRGASLSNANDLFSDNEGVDLIIRAQEGDMNQWRGRPGNGGPGGAGFGGRPGGFGGAPGFGGGFRRSSSAVQTAATKAMREDGTFVIATFDKELEKQLNNADNEDDGILDSLEQTDAFGMPLVFNPGERQGRGGEGAPERGGRNGDNRNANNRENRGRGDAGSGGRPGNFTPPDENVMRAGMIPTPDPSLFVGVASNPSFKFAKPFKAGETAEKVEIAHDYALGKYEVRNREYKEFVDATKREKLPTSWKDGSYPEGTKNCPVVGITVQDANDYCEWLSTQYEGWTFRLPTEAEFENAATGSKKQLYPWGTSSGFSFAKNELVANCQYNATIIAEYIAKDASVTIDGKSVRVDSLAKISNKGVLAKEGWRDSKAKSGFTYSDEFKAKSKVDGFLAPVYKFADNRSPYGCVGMAGNAAEWTSTEIDGKNVARGGSWYSSAEQCAATYRGESFAPDKGQPFIGFRVVAVRAEKPEAN